MRELTERVYFALCLALGRLLRSGKYSKAWIVDRNEECQVRKQRLFYAPLLVWLSAPLGRVLDTGVRVLPQRDWEERERRVYQSLHGSSIRIDADGMLVLPWFPGETLATLLEDPNLKEGTRRTAIERAVVALAEFHQLGITHGDAMAENVMVDLAPRRSSGRPEHLSKGDGGAARWFDFETVHDSRRAMAWRRADDVRALLATCLVRTPPGKRAETLAIILDAYGDEDISRLVGASFTSILRRPLTWHLAQAALSIDGFREVGRLLRERLG